MSNKSKSIYYLKKFLLFLASVIVLSIVVFYIARLAPGDPLLSYYGERATQMAPAERDHAMERLGLNAPIYQQYGKWLVNALHGDMGISFKYKQDVVVVIKGRLLNTLLLGGIGFIVLFILSLLLGVLCAWWEGSFVDKAICQVGTLVSCVPEFWTCLLFIYVFSILLKIFPSSGAYSIGHADDVLDRIHHLILPLIIVVINHLWYYAFMIRNKLLEEIREDYVLLAKVKGLNKRQIIFRHCIRGILPTYFSIMAISVPHVLGGTYIIETLFSYPGIGALAYESAKFHDYNLLMILCIISGVVVIFFNMLSQIINERIDPRVKATQAAYMMEVSKDE